MQDEPATPPPNEPRLLFIIGMWRSGTSLLHSLVNRHPQVALLYEAEPLTLWPRRGGYVRSRDWPRRLEFYNQTFTRHDLDENQFVSKPPGREGALSLYREYAHVRGATVMGEKAPSYYTQLPVLAKLFPDAHFLIVWRDPIECCRSAARAALGNRFFSQRGMTQQMLLGAEVFAQGVESLLREKRNVCEVVYDELVENPERELRRICGFLKIPFAPVMLDLKSADVSSVPSGEHHAGVRSGIIGKTASDDEILPAAFVAKGRRYTNLWRGKFSNLGFARALEAQSDAGTPGAVEQFTDRCARISWGGIDAVKHLLFRHIPLSFWARLRSSTPRAQTAPEKRRG